MTLKEVDACCMPEEDDDSWMCTVVAFVASLSSVCNGTVSSPEEPLSTPVSCSILFLRLPLLTGFLGAALLPFLGMLLPVFPPADNNKEGDKELFLPSVSTSNQESKRDVARSVKKHPMARQCVLVDDKKWTTRSAAAVVGLHLWHGIFVLVGMDWILDLDFRFPFWI